MNRVKNTENSINTICKSLNSYTYNLHKVTDSSMISSLLVRA